MHKLGIPDALLLSHTAGRNQLLHRQAEWAELAVKIAERDGSEREEYLRNYLKHCQAQHDQ